MNEKCTTDQDNGMAERHKEQPVQQRMYAMLTALFSARKELTILFNQYDNSSEAVYCSEYTRAGERWSSNEEASDRSLVWRAADCCR